MKWKIIVSTPLDKAGEDTSKAAPTVLVPMQGLPNRAFQMGEILLAVLAHVVRQILKGDFVDMADLTDENLELEQKRGSKGEKKLSALGKWRLPIDVITWAKSFGLYAGAVVSAHPEKAQNM